MYKYKYYVYCSDKLIDWFNSYKDAISFLENLEIRYPNNKYYILKGRVFNV